MNINKILLGLMACIVLVACSKPRPHRAHGEAFQETDGEIIGDIWADDPNELEVAQQGSASSTPDVEGENGLDSFLDELSSFIGISKKKKSL